jgi:16S rRNA (guanine527-N7)-methyltransferase
VDERRAARNFLINLGLGEFHVEHDVEKQLTDRLLDGASKVGVALEAEEASKLVRFLDLLLSWNRKVNLTSLTDPLAAVEGHLVDSLPAVRMLRGANTVLDLGAGGGLPGIPVAVMLPATRVVVVDTVGKKVGFLKAAAAALGLRNVQAIHARAEGDPEREGIPICEVAISRAFMAPAEWVALAHPYIEREGSILAMLGAETCLPDTLAEGYRAVETVEYRLPESGAVRRIVRFKRG